VDILDKRLLVVTGKGGVGKSTVSAGLALCAARAGKRVLCCEVNAKERIAPLLGARPSGSEIQEAVPDIFTVNVRPREAMREYALMKVRFETIYNAVFENRLVRHFLRMIPSLAETVMLGKIWFEVEAKDGDAYKWDLVILDAPATGHGISFLRVPQVLLDTVPPGPLRDDAQKMHATLTDETRTSVQLVTLPEEMPVNETIELEQVLREDLGLPLGLLFLNGYVAPRFQEDEVALLEERIASTAEGDAVTPAVAAARAGLSHAGRAELSAFYDRKLDVEIPKMPRVHLPRLYTAGWGPEQVRTLADEVAAVLGVEP
jgi:anion-transporting  ArsA/GET3 family ATPase